MNVETTVRIRCLPPGLVVSAGVLCLMLIAGPRSACADPVSELASFSIFDKVDLAQLAKGDVKTAHMFGQNFARKVHSLVQHTPHTPEQLAAAEAAA